MKREFLQNLELSKEVIDAIMEENGRDIQAGKVWKEKYEQAVAEHEKQVKTMAFTGKLNEAIAQAKGRNAKAITALLDVEALQEDPAGIAAALDALKAEQGYLFEDDKALPVYARGTGTQPVTKTAPTTLAGALRERFERTR